MSVVRQRLSSVAMRAVGHSPKPINILLANHTPFITIVHSVYYFPLAWRKLLLDACRIQVPVNQNSSLMSTYSNINPKQIVFPSINDHPLHFDLDIVLALLEEFISTPILCSMLSYFRRVENTYHREEFLSQNGSGLTKKYRARPSLQALGKFWTTQDYLEQLG